MNIVAAVNRDRAVFDGAIGGNGHDGLVFIVKARLVVGHVTHLDLVVPVTLVAFDNDEIARLQRGQMCSSDGSGSPRNSLTTAQREPDTTATCEAPALRWRKLSRPSWSMSNEWCACLTVDTRSHGQSVR
jgi:hypothetical protein